MSKITFNPTELKVFTRAVAKDATVSNSTNPFGISFKGKRLDCDVFESASKNDKTSFTGAIAKSKLAVSAFAGTIKNTGSNIREKMVKMVESVGNISSIVDGISNKLNMDIVSLVKSLQFGRNKFNGLPVSDLADRFKNLNSIITA
jgi:hypothetical protein